MIRISGGRCGYSGYTCEGIPPLILSGGTVNCEYTTSSYYNYGLLPENAAGMTMQVPLLTVFDSGAKYPETCSGAEFYDAFNTISGGELLADNYRTVSGSIVSGGWVNIRNGLPCFTSGGVLQPGLLEPMISVDMPPVVVEYPTGLDNIIDGVMITIKGLNTWRTYIDASLAALTSMFNPKFKLKDTRPLVSGLESNPCSQFRIYKGGGEFIACKNSEKPAFGVMGGAVVVDGNTINVSSYQPVSNQQFPLNFYLDINIASSTAVITDSRADSTGHRIYHIGGVTATSNSKTEGCTIYNIWQDRCEFDDYGGGDVALASVVTMPTGGVGEGSVRLVTVTASGGLIPSSGASISVIMPYLDGIN